MIKPKELRPNQKAKIECICIARKLMDIFPDMPINKFCDLPELMEVAGEYSHSTRYRWIHKEFPDYRRKPGRPRNK